MEISPSNILLGQFPPGKLSECPGFFYFVYDFEIWQFYNDPVVD